MKNLVMCIVLISLCSCGKSSKPEGQKSSDENQLGSQSEAHFVLPKLNIQRSVTIDSAISILYEDMTIKSIKEEKVLGDKSFYLLLNEQTYPTYNEIELGFYGDTRVNNVFYFDVKKVPLSLLEVSKENLPALKMKEATNYFKDGLVWGKRNLDNPESDMLNKAFVIRTEATEREGSKEYTSQSTYLAWFECQEEVKSINVMAYSCGKFKLKFHYKLLDYSLTSEKI